MAYESNSNDNENQSLRNINSLLFSAVNDTSTGFSLSNFRSKVVRFTPTLDTSAYAGGDVLFDRTAVAVSNSNVNARGTILSASIVDRDDQSTQTVTLYFLNANVSLGTANSAPSITDDNASNSIIGTCTVTTGTDLGGCKFGETQGLVIPFELTGPTLYVAAVTGGTPTHTTSGVRVRLSLQLETNP